MADSAPLGPNAGGPSLPADASEVEAAEKTPSEEELLLAALPLPCRRRSPWRRTETSGRGVTEGPTATLFTVGHTGRASDLGMPGSHMGVTV